MIAPVISPERDEAEVLGSLKSLSKTPVDEAAAYVSIGELSLVVILRCAGRAMSRRLLASHDVDASDKQNRSNN